MLNPDNWNFTNVIDGVPTLMVLIDTEENFDWSKPLARESTDVTAMRAQHRAHKIFDKYGIKPVYTSDYPVVSQPDGVKPLKELFDDGKCVIGAHLHPWVNPPHDEVVCNYNSYPGNLPEELEKAKLHRLTETIAEQFGERPIVYKAGRYGVGFNTSSVLEDLGYEIDTSVLTRTDLSDEEGPNFSHCGGDPYWFGTKRRLLEIPMSAGYVGAFRHAGPYLRRYLTSQPGLALHLPGIFARLGLFERIVLTPEGITWEEHQRLTNSLYKAGQRVFSFTYHSPSLDVGYTPYVQSERDLAGFLDKFERYFDFFFGELGGRSATPTEIRSLLASDQAEAGTAGDLDRNANGALEQA